MRACSRDFLICALPLGVAQNAAGKLRLIWDGRHLNAFLKYVHFAMESLHVEGRALFEGCLWGGTIDVTSAFYHVDMDPSAMPYLGFEWEGQFYHYTVLPFGLAASPRIFTLVMGICVAILRQQGLRFMIYMDDLPFAQTTKSLALSQARQMVRVLGEFGWILSLKKCVGLLESVQSFTALGFVIDLAHQRFIVKPETVKRIRDKAKALLAGPAADARKLASLKGLMISTWLATGANAKIRTRSIAAAVDSRLKPGENPCSPASWRRRSVLITAAARAELKWWLANLEKFCSSQFRPDPAAGRFDGRGKNDASDSGWGGFMEACLQSQSLQTLPRSAFLINLLASAPQGASVGSVTRQASNGIEVYGSFKYQPSVAASSSTHREMFGLLSFLTEIAHLLVGGTYLIDLDNMGCVLILGGVVPVKLASVSGGSADQWLQKMAIDILDLALARNFSLVFRWIPRAQNERADLLSHTSELKHYDYSVTRAVFSTLDKRWGPHSVDRFASRNNSLLSSYNSEFFEAESAWTDTFSISWKGTCNWCHPPPRMVGKALSHAARSSAFGTLVVPRWPQAFWWPLLFPEGYPEGRPAPQIQSVRPLGPTRRCLNLPEGHPYGRLLASEMLALRFDFRAHS